MSTKAEKKVAWADTTVGKLAGPDQNFLVATCVSLSLSLGEKQSDMKANFTFHNLCGTVYRQGNVVFTPDGNSVLSPVGNRVSVFDLVK